MSERISSKGERRWKKENRACLALMQTLQEDKRHELKYEREGERFNDILDRYQSHKWHMLEF